MNISIAVAFCDSRCLGAAVGVETASRERNKEWKYIWNRLSLISNGRLYWFYIRNWFHSKCEKVFFRGFFFSFLFKSSFLSLSFTYHPLHPPLSISPSLTRLSSEILLSIDWAVALCSLSRPPLPQTPVCDRWPESQQNLGSHRVAWSDADFRKIECSVFVFFCWS